MRSTTLMSTTDGVLRQSEICHPHSQNRIIAGNANGVDAILMLINMEIAKHIGGAGIGTEKQMKKVIAMNGKGKNDTKDFLKELLGVVIGILVTLMIVFSVAYIGVKWNERQDEKKYNGGICPKCGGHYIYEQAVTHKYDTDYIYICDKCGDMIELESYRPQERKEE